MRSKKIGLFFGVVVVSFGIVVAPTVLAQTRTQTETQTRTQPIDVVEESVEEPAEPTVSRTTVTAPPTRIITTEEDIPTRTSLFFRNLKQQLQLVFTFNDTNDAALRLDFASENLQIASDIVTLTLDSRLLSLTNGLSSQAAKLVSQVNDSLNKLKAGDAAAITALNTELTAYYTKVNPIIARLKTSSAFSDKAGEFAEIFNKLDAEHAELQAFLEAQINEAPVAVTDRTITKDADNDGIDDELETEIGLDVFDFDTDQDSLSDLREIEFYGTDPTKVDTDGDGFRDGFEVMNNYNPAGEGTLQDHLQTKVEINGLQFISVKKTLPNLSPGTLKFLTDSVQKYQSPRQQ